MAVIIFSIILQTTLPSAFPEPDVWWVFLNDRGPNLEQRLEEKTIELQDSPSLERRIQNDLYEADELDLEPWVGYVEEVEAIIPDRNMRTTSRYLNAVSVSATERPSLRITCATGMCKHFRDSFVSGSIRNGWQYNLSATLADRDR